MLALCLLGLGGCGASDFLNIRKVAVDAEVRLFFGGGGNSLALVHGDEVLLVDPKFAHFAPRLRAELEGASGRDGKVRRVVLTHAHADHALGLSRFRSVGAVVAHPSARAALEEKERASGRLGQVPFVEVEKELRLSLGDETVRILHFGPGHTAGDVVVLLEKHKLLVAGDLAMTELEPFADPSQGGRPFGLVDSVEALTRLEFERVLPGHGRLMSRAELEALRDYLVALRTAARAAVAQGLDEAAGIERIRTAVHRFPERTAMAPMTSRERSLRAMFRAAQEEAKSLARSSTASTASARSERGP